MTAIWRVGGLSSTQKNNLQTASLAILHPLVAWDDWEFCEEIVPHTVGTSAVGEFCFTVEYDSIILLDSFASSRGLNSEPQCQTGAAEANSPLKGHVRCAWN